MEFYMFILGAATTLFVMRVLDYLFETYDETCAMKRNQEDCQRGSDGYCAKCHAEWYG